MASSALTTSAFYTVYTESTVSQEDGKVYEQVFIADENLENPVQLTFDASNKTSAVVSQDGSTVVYKAEGDSQSTGTYVIATNGQSQQQLTNSVDTNIDSNANKILLNSDGKVYLMGLDGSLKNMILNKKGITSTKLSNNGRMIAYTAPQTAKGLDQIYVKTIDAGLKRVTAEFNIKHELPFFSPDDSRIIYVKERKVYSVGIDGKDTKLLNATERSYIDLRLSQSKAKILFTYIAADSQKHQGKMDLDGTNVVTY